MNAAAQPAPVRHVYKILTRAQWQDAGATGIVSVPLDVADGYVHFSTAAQVLSTLTRHFGEADEIILLRYDVSRLPPLRWEPARGGDLFPHLYAPLTLDAAGHTQILTHDANGAWPDFDEAPQ